MINTVLRRYVTNKNYLKAVFYVEELQRGQ